MKVNQILYRRKYFLGGYETEDFELGMQLDPGDDPIAALAYIKEFIEFHKTPRSPIATSAPSHEAADPSQIDPLTDKLRRATQERRAKLTAGGTVGESQ